MKQVKSSRTWIMVLAILTTIGSLVNIFNVVTMFKTADIDYSQLPGLTSEQVSIYEQIAQINSSASMKLFMIALAVVGIIAVILMFKDFVKLGKLKVPTLIGSSIYLGYHVLGMCFQLYSQYITRDLQHQLNTTLGIPAASIANVFAFVPHIIMIILSLITFMKLSKLDQSQLDAQEFSDL